MRRSRSDSFDLASLELGGLGLDPSSDLLDACPGFLQFCFRLGLFGLAIRSSGLGQSVFFGVDRRGVLCRILLHCSKSRRPETAVTRSGHDPSESNLRGSLLIGQGGIESLRDIAQRILADAFSP